MCAYSIAWNESSPVGSSTNANTIDTELQDLKESVRERMNDILHSSTLWETDAHDPKLLDVAAIAGTPQVALCNDSANRALTSGVFTKVEFDQETFDTGGFHDNVTNNTRFTTAVAGYYMFHSELVIIADATGADINITTRLLKNNVTAIGNATWIHPGNSKVLGKTVGLIVLAAANDYFEWDILQASGGAWTVSAGSQAWMLKLIGTT